MMDKRNLDDYKSGFQFVKYNIEEIVFKRNPDYNFETKEKIKIQASLTTDFNYDADGNKAYIYMECRLYEDFIEKKYPFYVQLRITGEFNIIGNIDDGELKSFCEVNGTAALFPYLRTAISNITLNAGISPVILPLLNVHKLIENKNKQKPTQG